MDRAPTELLTKAKDRLVSQASTRAMEAKDSAYWAMWASIVLFLAVTAIGVMVFLVVIQRSISSPLVRLTGGMQELAAGNFDVALFGLGRKDEIGDIANTALVFKENGLAKIRMEQEQKAEQDKRAAAEREAAMQKMAAEFEAAVGGIVQAAVAGDFTQRVDLDGKTRAGAQCRHRDQFAVRERGQGARRSNQDAQLPWPKAISPSASPPSTRATSRC